MLYSIAYVLVAIISRVYFRLHIIGRENIPKEGGVIVASNHLSYLDIPLLGYSIGRKADYIGKRELFNIPIFSSLFRTLGGFPIDRERLDRGALKETIKRLKSGRVIVIYPEGTRSRNGRLQPGKPGVGMIVKMSGAKVIPAAIQGTDRAMPIGAWFIRPAKVTIRFGKPLDFSENGKKGNGRDRVEIITETIMNKISALFMQESN